MRVHTSRPFAWLMSPLFVLALASCTDDLTSPQPPGPLFSTSTSSTAGGPLILMGIDAEDGGIGGHGPISVYVDVVNSILADVTNGGSGILVIGGGKSAGDNVTTFWNAIASGTGVAVTYVNGATNIAAQSFSGFAMIGVASSSTETWSGGLTNAENDALAARQTDVANFVNAGGGLLAFSATGFTQPYGYLADVGSFTFNTSLCYSNITPTTEGTAIGITDALDVTCWHDEYLTFPSFLTVLATNASTGQAAAIGGSQVVIEPTDPELIELPSISIEDVTITSASKGAGSAASGYFVIQNASGGEHTYVTLHDVTLTFQSIARGGVRTDEHATCTLTPVDPSGDTLTPQESKRYDYTCSFDPVIGSGANELNAIITVGSMTNQLSELRGGPPPTSSENPWQF